MSENLDHLFLMQMGTLIIFMQAGFAFLEAGSVRAKNTINILIKNFSDLCFGKLQGYPSPWFLYSVAINLVSSPGLWAATAACYCPSMPGELPKFIATEYRNQGDGSPCTPLFIHSPAMFCYVFLCELWGPARAVGSYSVGPLARRRSQKQSTKYHERVDEQRCRCVTILKNKDLRFTIAHWELSVFWQCCSSWGSHVPEIPFPDWNLDLAQNN